MRSLSSKIVKGAELRPRIFVSDKGEAAASNGRRWSPNNTTRTLLDIARGDAAEVLARAEQEAAEVKKAAWGEGYKAGITAAKEEMARHLDLLAAIANQAHVDSQSLVRNAEQQVVELVVDTVRKLLTSELETNESVVVATLHEVMDGIAASHIVRVLISPDDFDTVFPFWQERSRQAAYRHIELVADDKLASGDCVIDTRSGIIDARVETKLSEMENAFWGVARGWR